jgi:hypoxanthine phosphoribosyltransferase
VANKKVLLVDEVADTGQSLKLAKERVVKEKPRKLRTVTMYMKPWSLIEPDYWGLRTSSWLVFPWEINETIQTLTNNLELKSRKKFDNLQWKSLSAKQIERFLNSILLDEHTRTHESH